VADHPGEHRRRDVECGLRAGSIVANVPLLGIRAADDDDQELCGVRRRIPGKAG